MYLVKSPKIFNRISDQSVTWRMNEASPELYITFDDGPVPGLTQDILDILKEKDVPATFFCVGDNIFKHPDVFQKLLDSGHTIGNHSFNHLNGWRTPNAIYYSNVLKFDNYYPTRLFRPPYGRIKVSQIRELKKNYHIVLWSILSGDFDYNTSPYKCYVNVVKNLHNGAIIVFHDNYKAQRSVLYALPRVIDYARQHGYSFQAFNEF